MGRESPGVGNRSLGRRGDVTVSCLLSQVPRPSHRYLWDGASLQPRGVRHAARLPHQLGLLEPAPLPVHDHVP